MESSSANMLPQGSEFGRDRRFGPLCLEGRWVPHESGPIEGIGAQLTRSVGGPTGFLLTGDRLVTGYRYIVTKHTTGVTRLEEIIDEGG